jgi:hypothetical protein
MKTILIGLMMGIPTIMPMNNVKVYFDHAEISKGEEVEMYMGESIPIEITGIKPDSKVSMKFTKTMIPIKKYTFNADKNGRVDDVFIVPKYELEKGIGQIEYQLSNDSKQVFEFKLTIAPQQKADQE